MWIVFNDNPINYQRILNLNSAFALLPSLLLVELMWRFALQNPSFVNSLETTSAIRWSFHQIFAQFPFKKRKLLSIHHKQSSTFLALLPSFFRDGNAMEWKVFPLYEQIIAHFSSCLRPFDWSTVKIIGKWKEKRRRERVFLSVYRRDFLSFALRNRKTKQNDVKVLDGNWRSSW